MKYEYTQGDEWKILIPATQDGKPIDLTDKEVILVIDGEEDRLESDVNGPKDHVDAQNGQTIFTIPGEESMDLTPGRYKIYIKIKNPDGTGKTTSSRKDFTVLPE